MSIFLAVYFGISMLFFTIGMVHWAQCDEYKFNPITLLFPTYFIIPFLILLLGILAPFFEFIWNINLSKLFKSFEKTSCHCKTCGTTHRTFSYKLNKELGIK